LFISKLLFGSRVFQVFASKLLLKLKKVTVDQVIFYSSLQNNLRSSVLLSGEKPISQEQLQVSLVVTFHDSKRIAYLIQAFESIRTQNLSFSEVVFVDSSEGGIEIQNLVIRFSDLALKHCRTQLQHPASKRNLGVKESSGDIICFLDDDNILLPTHCRTIVEAFQSDPLYDLVFTSQFRFLNQRVVSIPRIWRVNYRTLTSRNIADTSSMAIRKSSKKIPRWDSSVFHEDWAFLIDTFTNGARIKSISERTVLYRIHDKARGKTDFKVLPPSDWLLTFRPDFLSRNRNIK
jgi:glycosyltransferase involved in cell wall biosynthesis